MIRPIRLPFNQCSHAICTSDSEVRAAIGGGPGDEVGNGLHHSVHWTLRVGLLPESVGVWDRTEVINAPKQLLTTASGEVTRSSARSVGIRAGFNCFELDRFELNRIQLNRIQLNSFDSKFLFTALSQSLWLLSLNCFTVHCTRTTHLASAWAPDDCWQNAGKLADKRDNWAEKNPALSLRIN